MVLVRIIKYVAETLVKGIALLLLGLFLLAVLSTAGIR